MDGESSLLSSLHFCDICNKPFAQGASQVSSHPTISKHEAVSSRDRHIKYCRKTHSRPRQRQKSCRPCGIAKVKCSFGESCSRCTKKGIRCFYEDSTSSVPSVHTLSTASTPGTRLALPNQVQDVALPYTAGSDRPWPDQSITIDDSWPFDVDQSLDLWQLDDTSDTLSYPQSTSHTTSTLATKQLSRSPIYSRLLFDGCPCPTSWLPHSSELTVTTPVPNKAPLYKDLRLSSPIAQNNATLILQALRSYPQLMLRRDTFPPFIHPRNHNALSENSGLPEPIENCIGIAQIFASRTTETAKFVWRTIRTEQKRIMDEIDHLSKGDLLAAIQAFTIYVIMRIIDDHIDHSGYDIFTLLSFQQLSLAFRELCGQDFCQEEQSHPSWIWEDWIFAESRRRTALVWFFIDRVIYIKTGVPCDTSENFRELPVSSPKILWEARDAAVWQLEYRTLMARPEALRFFGTLIDCRVKTGDRANARVLDLWNSDVDSIGYLLNLAVSMT